MTERVLVLGAGAVGLCCAYFLQRAGFEVTVLDAGPVGDGASWGNAGWISPSLSAPIPGPAALRTALGSVGKPDSPLWLRPQADPGFALWGLSFLRHCTRASNERGLAATAMLSRDAFRYYDEMRADGVPVGLERRGLLSSPTRRPSSTLSWPSWAGCPDTASRPRSPGFRRRSAGTGSRSSARAWRAGSASLRRATWTRVSSPRPSRP